MTTTLASPPFADCRAERHTTGKEAIKTLLDFTNGVYTVYFDQRFQVGDLLRSYEKGRYHLVDPSDFENAYCVVEEVVGDLDADRRSWGLGFPYRTRLWLLDWGGNSCDPEEKKKTATLRYDLLKRQQEQGSATMTAEIVLESLGEKLTART